MKLEPTLHKPIPLQTRVTVEVYGKQHLGTIGGIASMHVIFTYIVVLDEPYEDPDYGLTSAIVIHGPMCRGLNGEHWRNEEIKASIEAY